MTYKANERRPKFFLPANFLARMLNALIEITASALANA
jgi:hypothetical protein